MMISKIARLLLITLVIASACKSRKKSGVEQHEGLTGGIEVFSDDFERNELGANWISRSTNWSLVDGWLRVKGDRNEGLWLNYALPERCRVEFDARAASDEGDIKFEIFNTEPRHQTGYIVVFGGWKNTISIIARLNEHGEDRRELDIVPEKGRVYHFVALRTDGTLRWYVDGKLMLEYPDETPIRGRYFGFNDWNSEVFFDNLKIYKLP